MFILVHSRLSLESCTKQDSYSILIVRGRSFLRLSPEPAGFPSSQGNECHEGDLFGLNKNSLREIGIA